MLAGEASDRGQTMTHLPHFRLSVCGGYPTLGLSKGGKVVTKYCHRLVLEAFIGPQPKGHQCLHRSGVGTDNRLSNLRWASPRANSRDAIRHQKHCRGERHPGTRLSNSDVREIRDLRHREGWPYKKLAKRFRVSPSGIGLIVSRVNWSHV